MREIRDGSGGFVSGDCATHRGVVIEGRHYIRFTRGGYCTWRFSRFSVNVRHLSIVYCNVLYCVCLSCYTRELYLTS